MHISKIESKYFTLKDIRAKNHPKKHNSYSLDNFKTVTVSEDEMVQQRAKIAQRATQLDRQLQSAPSKKYFENFIDKIIRKIKNTFMSL